MAIEPLGGQEIQNAQALVAGLEKKHWTRAQIARAIGFTPANVSTLMNRGKGIARERFEALKRLAEGDHRPGYILPEFREGAQIPTGLVTKVRTPDVYLEGEYVDRTRKMVEMLKERGFKMDEIAEATGYTSTAGLRQSLNRGKINPDVYNRLQQFIESEEALKRALQLGHLPISVPSSDGGPIPKANVKDPDLQKLPDAISVTKVALNDLRHARAALEAGLERKVFKTLMEPGIYRMNRSICDLERQLEEVFV